MKVIERLLTRNSLNFGVHVWFTNPELIDKIFPFITDDKGTAYAIDVESYACWLDSRHTRARRG